MTDSDYRPSSKLNVTTEEAAWYQNFHEGYVGEIICLEEAHYRMTFLLNFFFMVRARELHKAYCKCPSTLHHLADLPHEDTAAWKQAAAELAQTRMSKQ